MSRRSFHSTKSSLEKNLLCKRRNLSSIKDLFVELNRGPGIISNREILLLNFVNKTFTNHSVLVTHLYNDFVH